MENDTTTTVVVKDTALRADRFKRLAKKRTVRILKLLSLLENCANKTNYYYSEDQINKIFTTIEEKLKRTKDHFNNAGKEKIDFEL